MSACVTSKSLDASKNNPIIDGWPITKVAVFLVDSCKENCILFHSSITQGVWSVIEKDVNDASQGSEDLMETRSANKKKQLMKKMDATSLQQLAYFAVKETCGIDQAGLKILDNHLVYSTSKPKTTVQLYIMQCTQTNLNMDLVPINEVMDSLRGSLVHRESVTPVVEYFHLLPFADKILDRLKSGREISLDTSQHFQATKENVNCNSSLSSMEQPQDPSHHLEDVKNTCSDSYSKEELLPSISEQNCTNFHDSEELNLKISDFCEATEEVINGNICHLIEDSVADTPKNCDVSEARNCNNDHLKEEYVAVTPKICESTRAMNGNNHNSKESPILCETSVVRNGDRKHLEGESYPHASQPFDDQAEFRNARSFNLDEEPHPCNSLRPESGLQNLSIYRRKQHPTELVVYKKRNRSQKNNTTNQISCPMTSNAPDYPRKEAEQCETTGSSNFIGTIRKKSIDTCEDIHDQKLVLSVQQTDEAALTGRVIVAEEFCDIEKDSSSYQITDTAMSKESEEQDGALVPFGSDFEHLCNSQLTITSKDPSAKTVLNVLLRKREQLSQQLRNIADEIASCEGNIQTILRGGEDQLAVKLESLVDGCTDISQHTSGGAVKNTTLLYNNHDLSPVLKRKRLSEAILGLLSPCQELDAICNKNFWMLPSYILSPLEAGFQATVNVKGVDFDCSSEGTTCKTPHEARNSAASIILVKLQSLAAKS